MRDEKKIENYIKGIKTEGKSSLDMQNFLNSMGDLKAKVKSGRLAHVCLEANFGGNVIDCAYRKPDVFAKQIERSKKVIEEISKAEGAPEFYKQPEGLENGKIDSACFGDFVALKRLEDLKQLDSTSQVVEEAKKTGDNFHADHEVNRQANSVDSSIMLDLQPSL